YLLTASLVLLSLSPGLLAQAQEKQAQEKDDEWKAKDLEGWQACARRKYKEGEPLLKEAVALAKKYGEDDRRYALSLAHLALAQQRLENAKEAEKNARAAQAIFKKTRNQLNPETVRGTHTLAEFWQGQKQYDEAERLYAQ